MYLLQNAKVGVFFLDSLLDYWSLDQTETGSASVYPRDIDGNPLGCSCSHIQGTL